jgi:hypothetical protein
MFNSDETIRAASLRRNKVIAARVPEEIQEAISLHARRGFRPIGPWITAADCDSDVLCADELFMGQGAFVRESRSGWCTGPIFAASAEHFCGWLTGCRTECRCNSDSGQRPGACRSRGDSSVSREPCAGHRAASSLHALAAPVEPFQGPLLGFSAPAAGSRPCWALRHSQLRRCDYRISGDEGAG